MYKCYDCGCVFENPKHYVDDCTPGGAFEGGSFNRHYDGCPNCSGSFGKAEECAMCGEVDFVENGEYDDDEGGWFTCQHCLENEENGDEICG